MHAGRGRKRVWGRSVRGKTSRKGVLAKTSAMRQNRGIRMFAYGFVGRAFAGSRLGRAGIFGKDLLMTGRGVFPLATRGIGTILSRKMQEADPCRRSLPVL